MNTFALQIVTMDGIFFDQQAEKVIVRTINGDIGILSKHADYVAPLGIGTAQITAGGTTRYAACSGGYISVRDGRVNLVPQTFEWSEDIDVSRAEKAKQAGEERKRKAKSQTDLALAELKIKRALTRIHTTKYQ